MGAQAVADTTDRMSGIKLQMQSIGDTVMRLNEHSYSINQILEAVQDLADQSNVLAVNASIEAARAGDEGKAFAVVALEIKSLADQSKQATGGIRSILDEIRKRITMAVSATQHGSEAVQAGMKQAHEAGSTIESLSESVEESAQAASVIKGVSAQQEISIDQVSEAMWDITAAMDRVSLQTSTLKDSAEQLSELGTNLKQLVEDYKV